MHPERVPMSSLRLTLTTSAVMVAFAANSLLCREALASGSLGASSFTLVRLACGAVCLWILARLRSRDGSVGGDWLSAAALFGYAAAFSFAYISLSAGTGALLLFAAVQITMIAYGLWCGERLTPLQIVGAVAAVGGLVWLVLPGVEAPEPLGALLMLTAGASWGVYSLRGRDAQDPTATTAGNFIRALPFAVALFLLTGGRQEVWTPAGLIYAAASGALASGLGYALWYTVLPNLKATTAATLQLSVPILAALGGVLLLSEALTLRFGTASLAVLGGILMFILHRPAR